MHDFFLFVQLFFSGHRCSSPFIAEGLCGSNAVCAMAAVLLRPTPVKSSIMEKVGCPKRLVTDVAAWSLTSSSYSFYQLGSSRFDQHFCYQACLSYTYHMIIYTQHVIFHKITRTSWTFIWIDISTIFSIPTKLPNIVFQRLSSQR